MSNIYTFKKAVANFKIDYHAISVPEENKTQGSRNARVKSGLLTM